MTADQVIAVAEQHHQAGRRAEAEVLCRRVLGLCADHAGALHLLGVVVAQHGRLEEAAALIERALLVDPAQTEAWRNLGCVRVNQGKLREAADAYVRLTQLQPEDATAHFALGIVLKDCGNLDAAIGALSTAVRLRPDFADAHFKLGLALRTRGRVEDAIAAYARAVALKPDFADAHNNLANALRDAGRVDEAIVEYNRAIQLCPDDAVALMNLGTALGEKQRFAEALPAYERAVRLRPGYGEAYNQMGLALGNLQRFDEALAAHRIALSLAPDDPAVHEAMGATLLLRHDMQGAAARFRRVLEMAPSSATSLNGLGMALRALGEFEEAGDCFRRALEISPDKAFFHKNLISTGCGEADPGEASRLRNLLDQEGLRLDERVDAGFALGKLLDDDDRFDDAFAAYERANSLFRESRAAAGERFDADKLRRTVDQMIGTFTPAFFAERAGWGNASEVPVFIVGMPRSGTTLVEQIAASHPLVFGAGELQDVERLASAVTRGGGPARLQDCDAASIHEAAGQHLGQLRSLGAGAARVIDKMPGNVFHLALIALLFPRARVIVCRRDARDNCLSCYFQQFGRGDRHLYIYDLVDCARQYLETERLVRHWLKTLPLQMMEMRYEEMVADQEGQSRRLIDFLGLPWDPSCLEFHKTQRPVVTASVWQVRQPMYTRSVGRWRNYERHLGPLLHALELSGTA